MSTVKEVAYRWESLSPRKQHISILFTLLSLYYLGWAGFVVPALIMYFTVRLGVSASTLQWFREVSSRYHNELSSEDEEVLSQTTSVVVTKKTAVRYAILAQSKVGILKPTVANRLVYETTLLHIFDEFHVRHNVRMTLLGEALVACFLRPIDYQRALEVIENLGGDSPLPDVR